MPMSLRTHGGRTSGGRHDEPGIRENGRRVDPVLVIKEVQDAGFVLDDFSNLYYRPDDTLALEVGNQQ